MLQRLHHELVENLRILVKSLTNLIIIQLQEALKCSNLLIAIHHNLSLANDFIRGWWDACCEHCRPHDFEVGIDKTFTQLIIQQQLIWLFQIILQINQTVKVLHLIQAVLESLVALIRFKAVQIFIERKLPEYDCYQLFIVIWRPEYSLPKAQAGNVQFYLKASNSMNHGSPAATPEA